MHIAICDDNEIERNLLHYLLKKFFSEASVSCEFTPYSHGDALCDDIAEGTPYDILFLDLFMGDSFGLDIARKCRTEGYEGKIIFCTSSAEFALESYKVYASGYIVKPYSEQDIQETLNRFLPEFERNYYPVYQKKHVSYIPVNEILYVESNNSRCILHQTENRTCVIYKKLGQIEAELNDSRFLRCHQSYLVNMNRIREVTDVFILQNGEEILIRQKSKNEIRHRFLEYRLSESEEESQPVRQRADAGA